jgi:hypothetical protein
MQIIIQDQGDRCAIVATSVSSNTLFPLTITVAALRDGLRAILASAATKELAVGPASLVRTPDGIDLRTSTGRFAIPYQLALPLVLACGD